VRLAREWLLLLGALIVVAALYSHYMGGHSAYLVEAIFVAVGAGLGLWSLRGIAREGKGAEEGLLIRFLVRYITKEQCAVLVPLSGLVLIVAWSAWKLFVVDESNLRMEDFIVTLFGLSLVLYHASPSRFVTQRDFVVLYLLFLTVVFAVIWKLYTLTTGESYSRITAYSEYYLITIPVVTLVRLLGVDASAELDLSGGGLSNLITYEYNDSTVWLAIGSGCSGLYSAGLFFSAFLAFVLVRYEKIDKYILTALGIGLFVTWLSNILRMVITILVGSLYGHPALVFTHSYLGVLLFVAFVAVFWFLVVKWLDRMEQNAQRPEPNEKDAAAQQA
jgi:exosortase/archaeosortase family protein